MELVRRRRAPVARSSRGRRSRTPSPSIAATGGSTNGVLHLLAIAREFGIPFDDRRLRRASPARTPIVADMKPGGRYVATDMLRGGRRRARRARAAQARGLLHGDAPNVDGRTLGEIADGASRRPRARRSSSRSRRRSSRRGGLAILHGNLAPEGCVVKLAGHERLAPPRPGARLRLRGGLLRGGQGAARSQPGDVVVIRYEGPAGGPGMREMLHVTARDRRRGARRLGRARSPTAASRARRTASWSATSRPRPRAAARSRRSRRATRS